MELGAVRRLYAESAAVVIPLAYQAFRMGYYALLVPNTGLAKAGGSSWWSQGFTYLWNFAAPYTLWLPLLLAVPFVAMPASQWHRFYPKTVAAPPELLFDLLSDLPNYGRWLPPSEQYAGTTDVEPYPVRSGSRYHDGKPDEPGKDWWGSVVGFQRPGEHARRPHRAHCVRAGRPDTDLE